MIAAASTQATMTAIVRLHSDGGPRWGSFRYALAKSAWISDRATRQTVRAIMSMIGVTSEVRS